MCSGSAKVLRTACGFDSADNYRVTLASCMNLTDAASRNSCLADAQSTRTDDTNNCGDVYNARLEVCNALGEAAYAPPFGPPTDQKNHLFINPLHIDAHNANPYFPLIQGSQWKYKTTYPNEDGDTVTEQDTVTVTGDTKLIEGVRCVVVDDVVQSSDGTIENTQDWFAQDRDGNVWYCGEISQQKQINDGDRPSKPELVGIEGSWKAGRDFGLPGIQMLAEKHLKKGKTYRQELLWVDAEDVATILDVNASGPLPNVNGGTFRCNHQCLKTRDYAAIEPDANEHKYYKKGVGLMLEVDLTNGARNELISYTHPD